MMPSVQVWERITRRVPLGLQVWDTATATHLVDGLEINVTAGIRSASCTRAFANRSGIYCAFGVPGLNQFELNAEDDVDAWKTQPRRYKIDVRDPADRFLPFSFDADLPARGLFKWLPPLASPPQPFVLPTGHGSPPEPMVQGVPLFSSTSRPVPDTLAVVRAELREIGTERPAAWSLLTVSIDAIVRGIGLADREGRVAILFPYPERSRPVLTSPPSATNDFRWSIELTAYYIPRQPNMPAPAIPDLADLLKQLSSPRTLFYSTVSPAQALPALPLEYRVPLTVCTEITASGRSSFLFVNTA
jgi:hypothetical protein